MDGAQAQITARIWEDPEWRALSVTAQWLYQSGLSQHEITKCGLLPLRESRWAGLAAYLDIDEIQSARKLLVDTRFWVVDEESEEVLYRSFMRTREVWRNNNMLKAACLACHSARGPGVRAALLRELHRLPQDHIQRLRPARNGQRRPWLVYVETMAMLRGEGPNGPFIDNPDIGQLTLDAEAFGGQPDGPQSVTPPPNGRTVGAPPGDAPGVRRTAAAATPFLPQGLGQGLPQALGEHKNYVVGGTEGQLGSCTSGVISQDAREETIIDVPPLFPPGCGSVDPEDAQVIAMARSEARKANRLLNQPWLHAGATALVDRLTADWPVPPTGKVRDQWRVEVSTLLKDAIPEDAIAAGLAECVDKGYGPRALATFVFNLANRGTPDSRAGRAVKATLSHVGPDDGPGLAAYLPGASLRGTATPPRQLGPGND
jgi:hypothetical protein